MYIIFIIEEQISKRVYLSNLPIHKAEPIEGKEKTAIFHSIDHKMKTAD